MVPDIKIAVDSFILLMNESFHLYSNMEQVAQNGLKQPKTEYNNHVKCTLMLPRVFM